ncbi:MAG TPA: hypothetical protein DCS93_03200 [Microscillaceae bacterium]|nr:hypothetical protein [Microscillaceae bacterium]
MSFSKNNLPLCTSIEAIKAHAGKPIRVFGELARHHQLPHHPYILLLDNNEWVFLGNKDFFQGKSVQTTFVLVEGVIKLTNPGFQLANFKNEPLPAVALLNASKPPVAKEPEKVIRAHPFVQQVVQIQAIPACYIPQDIEKNLDRWVVVFGLLSVKDQQVAFQANRAQPWLQFDTAATHPLTQGKHQPGMVIVKFTKANQAPSTTLLQRLFPVCETVDQFKQYGGRLVAFSGKVKEQARFKVNGNTWLYLYRLPLGLNIDKVEGEKLQFITRVYAYGAPQFFELPLFFNRPSFGQIGYIKNGLWYDQSK